MMTGKVQQARDREERWRALVEKQKASGLSAAKFCRQEGINVWSLYDWRKRLEKEDELLQPQTRTKVRVSPQPKDEPEQPVFLPLNLEIVSEKSAPERIELLLHDGTIVRNLTSESVLPILRLVLNR